MNIISQLRRSVHSCGTATISTSQFNQLQNEWICRCMDTKVLGIIKAEAIEQLLEEMQLSGANQLDARDIKIFAGKLRLEAK